MTVVAVTVALALTGWLERVLRRRAATARHRRNVVGGLLAMAVTYLLGSLVGPGVG